MYKGAESAQQGQDSEQLERRVRELENELAEHHYLFRTALDNLPSRVFWKDTNSCYLGANKQFIDDAGCNSIDELIGRSDRELPWDSETAEAYRRDDQQVMQSSIPRLNYEEPQERSDGSKNWLRTNKVPLLNEHGELIGVLGTYEDITEFKLKQHEAQQQLEQLNNSLEQKVKQRTLELEAKNAELLEALLALRSAQDELEQNQSLASLGALVSSITHEINTPLGVGLTASSHMSSTVDELEEKFHKGKLSKSDLNRFFLMAKECAELVHVNLSRASSLISSFKRVAVDKSSEQIREFELAAYCKDIVLSLSPRLRSVQVEPALRYDDDLMMKTYAGAFAQVIINMIMNSLYHAFNEIDKPEITIEFKRRGDMVEFIYSDNGVGIDADTVQHIFDPFFTTKRNSGGSGLGLSIVHNIVTNKLGGSIECTSSPGRGAVFVLNLPIVIDL